MLVHIALKTMVLRVENGGGVVWTSNLERDVCPHCDTPECNYSCDHSKAEGEAISLEMQTEEQVADRLKYNFALDVIESLVLSIAINSQGVVDTETLQKILDLSIETTLDKIENELE